ncbi:MAG: Hpt domain-containing protein [Anaerolineales bacterium]|jgi:HPt (histidine-containing phosphotransfer) domain-containing protein
MSEVIIDQATFAGMKDMVGDDFVGELVETFLEEAPGLLAEMDQALKNGDAETFRRSAHSLKSNGASFGAMRLASLARELEHMGRDGRLDEAGANLLEAEIAYQQAAEALKALL